MAFVELLVALAGESVEARVDFWNGEMARVFDTSLLSVHSHKV